MNQPNTTTVAAYISERIKASSKLPATIAEEVEYSSNMISMISQGRSKLPINKVVPFAKALGIDPVFLFRLVLGEYSPTTLEVIDQLKMISRE